MSELSGGFRGPCPKLRAQTMRTPTPRLGPRPDWLPPFPYAGEVLAWPDPLEGRALARHRTQARRDRHRAIRRRAIGITLALFLAVWLAIFGQLITGHDPALARSHVLRNAPALGVSRALRAHRLRLARERAARRRRLAADAAQAAAARAAAARAAAARVQAARAAAATRSSSATATSAAAGAGSGSSGSGSSGSGSSGSSGAGSSNSVSSSAAAAPAPVSTRSS